MIALAVSSTAPRPWRARARWASGLDNMWETQYAEAYPDYADDDAWDAAYEREAQRLQAGRLGDIPLLMVPAGMVNEQLRFPSCADKECECCCTLALHIFTDGLTARNLARLIRSLQQQSRWLYGFDVCGIKQQVCIQYKLTHVHDHPLRCLSLR